MTTMTFDITHILVLMRTPGTDQVWLHTTLPSGMPAVDPSDLKIRFEVRRRHGLQYVLDHFPGDIPVETLDTDTGKRERIR